MKYQIITFGCQMNKSDSERIAEILENGGYKPTSKENEADLIVVNMCSVRQSAVDRVYGFAQKIKNLKIKKPKLKTVLTGCILEKDRKKFKSQFNFILNIKTLPIWPKILKNKTATLFMRSQRNCSSFEYLKIQPKYTNNFSALVPVSTGCNSFCAYCVVPYVRGPLICRDHREVLREIKELIKKGFKEIWLLGQNVNDYKSPTNPKINFAKLLEKVNDLPANFWIRFTSPHPQNFSDELIEKMAKSQKVTPYLNLPLQSGDDEILKKMRRNYTTEKYGALVKKIRQAFRKYRKGLEKEVLISTDIIVGFPEEKKEQFENTLKFFKKIRFAMAYIAKYSPRPGTLAFNLKDEVTQLEKKKREKKLTKILKENGLKFNKKFLGKKVEVLVDEKRKNFYFGKTRHYQTIKIKTEKNILGELVKAKVKKAMSYGLEGKLVKTLP